MAGWTNLPWFRWVEGCSLQVELVNALRLSQRPRGTSVVLDLCLYCLGCLRLYLGWLGEAEPQSGRACRGVSWILGRFELFLQLLQGTHYLEYILLW